MKSVITNAFEEIDNGQINNMPKRSKIFPMRLILNLFPEYFNK